MHIFGRFYSSREITDTVGLIHIGTYRDYDSIWRAYWANLHQMTS